MKMWKTAALLLLIPSTAGCLTGVVKELAKDPSTSCVEVSANYLVAALNVKWFRTQQPGKSECSQNGMKNDAGSALPKLPKP